LQAVKLPDIITSNQQLLGYHRLTGLNYKHK